MEAIDELRQIEKTEKELEERRRSLENNRADIIRKISKKELSVRLTEVTKPVLDLREKIMRIEEIRSVLERYRISLDDVALVKSWGSTLNILNNWETRSDTLICPISNIWYVKERYLYGGPQDEMKVFFDQSNNGQYYVCGFVTTFPIRPGKEVKARKEAS